MTGTDENRRSRAHVDLVLLALVFGMSLFGIVAVCVATFSPGSNPDTSFLNHIFESSYATCASGQSSFTGSPLSS